MQIGKPEADPLIEIIPASEPVPERIPTEQPEKLPERSPSPVPEREPAKT